MIGKLLWKPLYMTYDSLVSAFEGEVIPEVDRGRFGDPKRMRLKQREVENMLVHGGNEITYYIL